MILSTTTPTTGLPPYVEFSDYFIDNHYHSFNHSMIVIPLFCYKILTSLKVGTIPNSFLVIVISKHLGENGTFQQAEMQGEWNGGTE